VQFNNNSIGSTSFNWNFGDSTGSNLPDPFHTYPDTGVYWVTLVVFNTYGCSDTTSGTVIVTPNDAFFVPNAFHPQSNGNNNHFQGYGIGITSFEMDIFDRWSERVFYSTNVNDGWDGTINGQDAPEGVYVYHISVSINNHAAVEYTGSITLVR
jgi:gliding motility-associated-like protein